jgi:hypothetical protein
MLKHLFSGFLTGIISVLLPLFWIYPLYSDYRAVVETQKWYFEIQPIQFIIEDNALKAKSTQTARHRWTMAA